MNTLESTGFLIINQFIDAAEAHELAIRFDKHRNESHINNNISLDNKIAFGDDQISTSYVGSRLPMFEKLLDSVQSTVENITEKSLFPAYSYARIYYSGAELKKHRDRPSCEYSVTLCLRPDSVNWPLCILDKNGIEHQVIQNSGDAIIYKGCEQVHWRGVFTGTSHSQVFLHYVDQNGPYSEWKYDKKSSLNIN